MIGTLLITSASGTLGYQPIVHADTSSDTLSVTQSREINYVDQATDKVVGHQKLLLSSNGKALSNGTKLKLPAGYQRVDKFVYDLSATAGQNPHYTVDHNGQLIWNVFVTNSDDSAVEGKDAKTVTSINTDDNHDGSVTVTTTTTTTTGSKNTVETEKNKDKSVSSSLVVESASSSSPNSASSSTTNSSNGSSNESSTRVTASTPQDNSESSTSPSTQVSNTESQQKASTANATPNSASSSTPSSTNSSSTASSASSANAASGTPASGNSDSANTQQEQTLPQTSADKATPAVEQGVGLGLAGVLAGIGLAHLIKQRHKDKQQ